MMHGTIPTQPSPLGIILYSTNVFVNPNLGDGDFRAISLFGTNKFLHSNVMLKIYSGLNINNFYDFTPQNKD